MSKPRDFLGAYRLARLIRMGSTCQVWEAIHVETKKNYALKVLRPDQRGNKTEIGFLKHEFSIAGDFTHKNIIKVHEFVMDSATPYLVLELFSELNMKQALRQGPGQLAYMIGPILEQCVESLHYLHQRKWVHCDIKPDNLLVSPTGEVKLIDFTISRKMLSGLAKIFATKSKTVAGTRSYMSPEQIRGLHLDQRSDIYSLGCVFYEVVTGKLPFTGESPNDLLNKHISGNIPSPATVDDNITGEFCELLRNMMAKKADSRPDSMWDILKTLRAIKIFRRPPRKPDRSIFDEFPMGGRVDGPEEA